MNIKSTVLTKLNVALFAGAAAAFFAVPAAQASVVYVNLAATPLNITNSIDGIYLNVVTGVSGSSGAAVAGWDLNPYNNGAGLTFYGSASPAGILATGTPGTTAEATSLAFGALISSAGQFNQFQTVGTGGFQTTGQEYLGFRFLNESTGALDYGWMLFKTTGSTGFPASILGYAYENTGLSITAGQTGAAIPAVPEPSSFAMLAVALAGGLGLRALKRRRAS